MLYTTKNGSAVTVKGKHGGEIAVDFNWFEELHACIDCVPNIDDTRDSGFVLLHWDCASCGGGISDLKPSYLKPKE